MDINDAIVCIVWLAYNHERHNGDWSHLIMVIVQDGELSVRYGCENVSPGRGQVG